MPTLKLERPSFDLAAKVADRDGLPLELLEMRDRSGNGHEARLDDETIGVARLETATPGINLESPDSRVVSAPRTSAFVELFRAAIVDLKDEGQPSRLDNPKTRLVEHLARETFWDQLTILNLA